MKRNLIHLAFACKIQTAFGKTSNISSEQFLRSLSKQFLKFLENRFTVSLDRFQAASIFSNFCYSALDLSLIGLKSLRNKIIFPFFGLTFLNSTLGSHPVLYRIFSLKKGPVAPPSQVLKISYDPVTNREPQINEVFSDDGMIVMGSAGAAHWKSRLLIGSVFERLVYCEINVPYVANDIVDRWTI